MAGDCTRPVVAGVNHVGISVTDIERSIAFYCDVHGASLAQKPFRGFRGFSGRMAIVILGSHVLDLNEHATNSGDSFDPARTGLDHIGLSVATIAKLEAWADWLDRCCVEHSVIRESAHFGCALRLCRSRWHSPGVHLHPVSGLSGESKTPDHRHGLRHWPRRTLRTG
jgi:glyoxylase I family protein